VQEGEIHKVGVNVYTENEEEYEVELHEYDSEVAVSQIASLNEVKRQRDNTEVTRTLKDLEQAAREKKNVMPYLVDAVRTYATLGEMTSVFKSVYGEFKEPDIF
jgi:methylmalonyl-CoA mutase, N-terminal domain